MTAENPYAGQGPVLLDIGGDVGALVVTMPDGLDGVEIAIQPAGTRSDHDHGVASEHDHGHHDHDHDHSGDHGHDHHEPHVAVVERPVLGGSVPSLVYPELTEGDYELYRRGGGQVELTVTIVGGEVTEASWPDS